MLRRVGQAVNLIKLGIEAKMFASTPEFRNSLRSVGGVAIWRFGDLWTTTLDGSWRNRPR